VSTQDQPSGNSSETNETIAMGSGSEPGSGSVPILERYERIAELGRGGMGVVYKVRDCETGEILALKFLKAEIAQDKQILERFKNELRLAHKITHRNVARLYEFHRAGDSAYLSMEFVEGQSLRDILKDATKDGGKLDHARALEIARQLCAGLAEAHRQSIAHRDLKPENVMLTSSGEVKVMDFGISRSFGADATVTGAIIGTPAYMSPEQCEGKPADHRADIYALGLMLYEMYTGTQAFTGETPVSIAIRQIRERPELPRKLDPGLPKDVEQAILKCLEKNPADRFQSVDDVVVALEGGRPVQAKPVRSDAAPRTRKILAIAAAVVVLAGAVGYFFWWRASGSDSVQLPLERFALANGLKVVLNVDHSSPAITLSMSYRAGARTDPPDRLGLSHLVSHLGFQGSPNVARGEFFSTVQSVGGSPGDNLSADASIFWINVPSNQLELALFLESDRMRALDITQAGLDEARSSLNEERRARVDNAPYGTALGILYQLAYSNPINQRTGYGTQEELAKATAKDAADFHAKYHGPSNAGLSLVGDFDPKTVRERIRHYFESIPARPDPPAPDSSEPAHTAEARRTIVDPSAQAPLLLIAWRVPPPSDPDWFTLFTLCEVLAANDAARLQAALVKGSGVASIVTMDIENNSAPDLIVSQVVALAGKDLGQVESLFYKEIDRVAREGVTQEEIERAQTEALRVRSLSMVTTTARAVMLSQTLAVQDHPEGINDWERLAKRATSDEIRRVAAKYFTPANRSVLVVLPKGTAIPDGSGAVPGAKQ
jgi:zinc protease